MATKYVVNSDTTTLVAATPKTVLQIVAAANHRVTVQGFSVTLAGISPNDLTVELIRQTSAGTGGDAETPFALDDDAAGTTQTTALSDIDGGDPSNDSPARILCRKKLAGSYATYFPMGQEIIVSGGDRLGIRCTSVTGCTVVAELFFEE